MSQNASKTQQKGLPPLQDNTASTPPPPSTINLLTLHVHFRIKEPHLGLHSFVEHSRVWENLRQLRQ